MPVGSPFCPKPFGTETAGTPTRLLAPMGEEAPMPGYALSKVLAMGLATVEREGATSRSYYLNTSAHARRIGARRRIACR